MENRSFAPLFTTNFFGVLNDNFYKTLAMFIVKSWIPDKGTQSLIVGLTAGLLVLPYIVFSPLADRLMQWYPKKKIFLVAKWAEIPIMMLAILGFILHSIPLVTFAIFLMGAQSSFYSPAKYALVRDIGGKDRISTGLGGMDGLSFLAMLMGTVLASFMVDYTSAAIQYACLILFAVLGLIFCYTIRAEEEKENMQYPIEPVTFMIRIFKLTKQYPNLNKIINFSGVFWWMAALMQMGLLIYGTNVLNLTSFQTGLILALAAIGITAGNILAGFTDRKIFLLGFVPVTGLIAALLLLVLFAIPLSPAAFSTILFLFAFEIGFFKLPLDAEIQKTVKGPMLNTILSYFNQVTFIYILIASGCYALVCKLFDVRAFLLLGAIVMAISSVIFFFSIEKSSGFLKSLLSRSDK